MNHQGSVSTHSGGFDSTSQPHKNNQLSPPADTINTADTTLEQPDLSRSLSFPPHSHPQPPTLSIPNSTLDHVPDGQVAKEAALTSDPQDTRGRSISNPEEKQAIPRNIHKSKQEPVVRTKNSSLYCRSYIYWDTVCLSERSSSLD